MSVLIQIIGPKKKKHNFHLQNWRTPACGGLFIRSLEKLRTVDPGFHTRNLLAVGLFAKPNAYKNFSLVDYYHTVTERVSHLPGVLSAGMVRTGIGNILENIERIRISCRAPEGLAVDSAMA